MLYVAIGRNVGDTPMSDADWSGYTRAVLDVIEARYGKVDTVAEGESRYGDTAEQTRVLVWFDVYAVAGSVQERLGAIAREYEQESIAYSVADTVFIDGI